MMRKLFIHAALFLGLLLFLLPPMSGAALSNASLQGNYFFALHKIEPSVAVGFSFTNAVGTLAFDGNGRITVDGSINRNSAVQPLSASGTYTLDSAGGLQLFIPTLPLTVSGSVSFDLNSLLATNVAPINSPSQEVLLGTKQPPPPVSTALLSGKYFLVERTITAVGYQFENSTGTVNCDGAGNCALELTSNRRGSITTATSSGTYQVTPRGSVLLSLADRSDPVTLGFAPGGTLGVGATVAAGSRNTYDIFVLTKADSAGLGNAGLGGSYQVVVGTEIVNSGLSTSAGRVVYRGDGRVSYQLRQNRMGTGTAGNITGDSTIFVAESGSLQFSGVQNLGGLFQGGVGSFGHSLVAASVNDTSVYNFLVAIRTPSQAAAAANGASFSTAAALSPGALFSLFGTNLARQTLQASSLPLLKLMGGAAVRVGGIEAPLLFVSPFQINAQVPFELPPGPAQITIVLDGVESGPLASAVNAAAPGVFTLSRDGSGAGIFQHGQDSSLVSEFNPARPGEVILIYSTGLGAVLPSVASGAGAPSDPLASAVNPVSVLMGGRESEIRFAGLAPDFVGLYQINVRVPPDAAPGPSVPVLVLAGGAPSNTVTLPVAP